MYSLAELPFMDGTSSWGDTLQNTFLTFEEIPLCGGMSIYGISEKVVWHLQDVLPSSKNKTRTRINSNSDPERTSPMSSPAKFYDCVFYHPLQEATHIRELRKHQSEMSSGHAEIYGCLWTTLVFDVALLRCVTRMWSIVSRLVQGRAFLGIFFCPAPNSLHAE